MAHNLEHTIAVLSRTPSTMNAMLRDLPEEWIHRNEGDGTFSAFDVIGHLIHGDRTDWIPRARIILEHGDTKPFEKFDRLAQVRESKGKSLPQLLDEFARIRAEKLDELRALNLKPQDFEKLVSILANGMPAGVVAQQASHLAGYGRGIAERHQHAAVVRQQFCGMPVRGRNYHFARTKRIG